MVIDQMFASPFSLFDSPFANRAGSPLDRILSLPWAGKSGLWLPALGSFANAALDPATSNVGLVLDQSRGVRVSGGNLSGLGPELAALDAVTLSFAQAVSMSEDASPGSLYLLSYTISAADFTGDLYLEPASGPFGYKVLDKNVGAHFYLLYAQDAQREIMRLGGAGGATGSIALPNISVREIPSGIGPLVQPSEALKPGLSGGALGFDGLQSTMSVDLPGGAGSSDCDVLVWIKTTDDTYVATYDVVGGQRWIFCAQAGLNTPNNSGAGGPSTSVDDTPVTTRASLQSATSDGEWHLMRARGANLSTWAALRLGAYTGIFDLDGQIGGMVVWDNTASGPLTAQQIDMMDRYVRGLVT